MKKWIWAVIGIAVIAGGIAIYLSQQKKEPEVIKIGAILPLTGPNAQWGIPPNRGAILAVEEVNSHGGINGKKIVYISEDTQCEPQIGVSAFRKLISDKEIKAVLEKSLHVHVETHKLHRANTDKNVSDTNTSKEKNKNHTAVQKQVKPVTPINLNRIDMLDNNSTL